MGSFRVAVWVVATAAAVGLMGATEGRPNQDVCVANLRSDIYVNGFPCLSRVQSRDFASSVLREAGEFLPSGVAFQTANVFTMPGLNTQGLAMNRVDYMARGLAIPHHHPRASELIMVTEGTLIAAFITTLRQPGIDNIPVIEGIQPNLTLYRNYLRKYDVAIFPKSHIHWVFNPSYNETAQYIAAYNSQNQGFAPTVQSLFSSNPAIPDYILALSLDVSEDEVRHLRNASHYNDDYRPHVNHA